MMEGRERQPPQENGNDIKDTKWECPHGTLCKRGKQYGQQLLDNRMVVQKEKKEEQTQGETNTSV